MLDFNIMTAFNFSCDQNYDEKAIVNLLSGNEGVCLEIKKGLRVWHLKGS